MEQSLSSLIGAVGLLVAAAIWAILFPRWARYVLAVSASLLSVIGMSRILVEAPGHSDGGGRENLLEFLLLPYAAMGIAMLLALLLLLLRKRRPDRERPRHPSEPIFGDARGRHKKPPPANAISRGARQDTGDGLPRPPSSLEQQPGPGQCGRPHHRPLHGPPNRGDEEALPAPLFRKRRERR